MCSSGCGSHFAYCEKKVCLQLWLNARLPNQTGTHTGPLPACTSFTCLVPRLLCPKTRVRAWERSYFPLPLLCSQWQPKRSTEKYCVLHAWVCVHVCVCVYECCNVHSLAQTWPKHSMRVVEPSNSLGNAVVLPARHRCQNWIRTVSRLRIMAATVHIPSGSVRARHDNEGQSTPVLCLYTWHLQKWDPTLARG